jgi:hypothetical protein
MADETIRMVCHQRCFSSMDRSFRIFPVEAACVEMRFSAPNCLTCPSLVSHRLKAEAGGGKLAGRLRRRKKDCLVLKADAAALIRRFSKRQLGLPRVCLRARYDTRVDRA